ncbi:Fic family protein [Planococcus sp. CP5-4]|uniref:Fic/DOC family protein n=1 Tax=unclassified Planococcus (in: firmicutes) TaxID=2662419 RepID=UPI001C235E82|nr:MULTISPECIES: Fic family protein [unclassified Planococcus (in: firmicutes)]MBU9673235.1 Fic family protein [Planococcus sp. CP5-4_YE]MBW6062543.1 Fic family protein [Planococcus sp. CP5-4]
MSKYQHTSMYCYPGTDVLINAFNIRDEDKLKELETVYALYRLSELQLKNPKDPSDLKVFLGIHRCLLQDVYPFAGKLREEMTSKGSSTFAHPKHLARQLKQLFDELAEEAYLKDLGKDVFIVRLAHYLAELNALHPFREGNGRTVREFARQLALNAGYRLDWAKIEEPAHIINAFVDSFNKDNERLEALLGEIIS